ncbi:MAG: hypothetical protein QM214_07390 [Bacillota bacterium]|jgi:hypothetical protein|nr:hypothetical protein [Candidatus Cloacimonadota bacterium]MDI9487708.1 hypothetical protein [Bacillota bacterium]
MTKIRITIEAIGAIKINKNNFLAITIARVLSTKGERVNKDNTKTEVSNGKHI